MINAIQIALSGLVSATRGIETAASNIANVSTSGALSTENGPAPYSARTTIREAVTDANGNGQGVTAQSVPANTPFIPAFDPDSPFADTDGLIGAPNVDLATEAVNLKVDALTFKANLETIQTASELSDELLRLFDDEA